MLKIIKFSVLILLMGNAIAFAEKILLSGKPVVLIPNADFYTFPKTYTPMQKYHFVDINGDSRVCFIRKQPYLWRVDLLRVWIIEHDKKFNWYCYRYDPRYFTINF